MVQTQPRPSARAVSLALAPLVALAVAAPAYAAPLALHAKTQPGAGAPNEQQAAEALRAAAVEKFAAGDFEAAIDGFKAAYERSHEPTDLFNLGRIYEEVGGLASALEYYEMFVAEPHVALEERRRAAERIEVLRVLVDPQPDRSEEGAAPASGSTETDTGMLSDRTMIVSGSVALGLGVALAAAGAVAFGIRGQRARDSISELSNGDNPDRLTLSEAEQLDARGRNADVLQAVFVATGGAVALVGASLVTVGALRRSKKRRASVQAAITPQQTMISTTWRF